MIAPENLIKIKVYCTVQEWKELNADCGCGGKCESCHLPWGKNNSENVHIVLLKSHREPKFVCDNCEKYVRG